MSCERSLIFAIQLCSHYYGIAPDVTFDGNLDMTFTYIPAHVYYIMFELLKNSMRATVEVHGKKDTLPSIRIFLSEGKRDICIKVTSSLLVFAISVSHFVPSPGLR